MQQRQFKEINVRVCLVIGCGKTCKNHTAERWFSIDKDREKKPDVELANLKELSPAHFKQNGNQSKFKAILLENVNIANRPSIQQIKPLLDDRGAALILFNSYQQNDWEQLAEAKIKVDSFFYYQDKMLFVTAGGSLNRTLEQVVNYLSEDLKTTEDGKQYLNFMKLYETEYNRLTETCSYIHPLLRSLLAHLTSYVIDRKSRPLKYFWENDDYKKFKADIEDAVKNYAMSKISAKQLREKLIEWKEKKQSSRIPSRYFSYVNLGYMKLSKFIDNSLEALDYYVKTYDPLPQNCKTTETKVIEQEEESNEEIRNLNLGL